MRGARARRSPLRRRPIRAPACGRWRRASTRCSPMTSTIRTRSATAPARRHPTRSSASRSRLPMRPITRRLRCGGRRRSGRAAADAAADRRLGNVARHAAAAGRARRGRLTPPPTSVPIPPPIVTRVTQPFARRCRRRPCHPRDRSSSSRHVRRSPRSRPRRSSRRSRGRFRPRPTRRSRASRRPGSRCRCRARSTSPRSRASTCRCLPICRRIRCSSSPRPRSRRRRRRSTARQRTARACARCAVERGRSPTGAPPLPPARVKRATGLGVDDPGASQSGSALTTANSGGMEVSTQTANIVVDVALEAQLESPTAIDRALAALGEAGGEQRADEMLRELDATTSDNAHAATIAYELGELYRAPARGRGARGQGLRPRDRARSVAAAKPVGGSPRVLSPRAVAEPREADRR